MDIRTPIGLLFAILGAVLGGYGIFTLGSPMYERSLGSNLNLWSGACLLVFGASMLAMAIMAKKAKKLELSAGEKKPEAPRA